MEVRDVESLPLALRRCTLYCVHTNLDHLILPCGFLRTGLQHQTVPSLHPSHTPAHTLIRWLQWMTSHRFDQSSLMGKLSLSMNYLDTH